MAKVIRKDLEAKLAALNGADWDSQDSMSESSGCEEDVAPPSVSIRAQTNKSNKRKKKGAKEGEVASVVPVGPAGEPSGVIYIGHIPHGFFEEAMNGFFSQFGDVVRVRLARSKKSGRYKVQCNTRDGDCVFRDVRGIGDWVGYVLTCWSCA